MSAARNNNFVRSVAFVAVAIATVYSIFVFRSLGWDGRDITRDFTTYYSPALGLRMGIDPYAIDDAVLGRQTLNLQNLPPEYSEAHTGDTPTFLMFIELLTFLKPSVAYSTWTALSVAALVASLAILFRQLQIKGPEAWLISAIVVMYPPVATTLWHGRGDLVLLLLFVLFGLFVSRNDQLRAGLTLGLAGVLRGYPFGLCAYLIGLRKWRGLVVAIFAAAAMMLLTILVVGSAPTFDYLAQTSLLRNGGGLLTDVPPLRQPVGWAHHTNNLNLGWFVKFAFDHMFGIKHSARVQLLRGLCAAGAELLLVIATFAVTTREPEDVDAHWRQLSLWIVTVTMISPLFWTTFFDSFIVFFVTVGSAIRRQTASRAVIWLAIAAYVLVLLSALRGMPMVSGFLVAALLPGHLHILNAFGEMMFASVVLTWLASYLLVRSPILFEQKSTGRARCP